MTKPTIGFIGLGLMGAAMVGRLQSLGYKVTVVANRSRANVEAAVANGAVEVGTAREVAAASDITMLCVDTSTSVEARMRGADGVIAGLEAGKVVIDFGTSLPGSTRVLGDEVAATGAVMLDSPIGRTPSHAVDGKLNLMCSGDKAAYDRVKPVLDDLGENVFHLGALGAGHTIKLINNFFAQCIANSMAESFAMADVAGVERQKVYDVIAAGPLHNGMMDFIAAYGLNNDDTKLAFSIENAAKDVGYYVQMCADAEFGSIMAEAPLTALKSAMEQGKGKEMVPRMVDFFMTRAKG